MATAILTILLIVAAIVVIPRLIGFGIGLLVMLLVWALIGFLGVRFAGGKGFGLLGNALLGVVGGFVGSGLLSFIGFDPSNWLGALFAGVVGSIVVIAIMRFFNPRFAR